MRASSRAHLQRVGVVLERWQKGKSFSACGIFCQADGHIWLHGVAHLAGYVAYWSKKSSTNLTIYPFQMSLQRYTL